MRDTADEFGQRIYDRYYAWQQVGAGIANTAVIGLSFYLSWIPTGMAPALTAYLVAVSVVRCFSSLGRHGVSERFNTFVMEDQADAGQKATHYTDSEALKYARRSGFWGGIHTATLSPYYIISNILFIPGLRSYPVLPRPYI